jgi:hypothetical protein
MADNAHGLDDTYFRRWFKRILPDLSNWKPRELARELARMSRAAAPEVLHEPEFLLPNMRARGAIEADLQMALAERDQLAAFANAIITCAFAGGDADGAHIQETAITHGLLKAEERSEPCEEDCACSGYGFPTTCNRRTDLLKSFSEAAKRPRRKADGYRIIRAHLPSAGAMFMGPEHDIAEMISSRGGIVTRLFAEDSPADMEDQP